MGSDYSVFWNETVKNLDGLISTNDINLWIKRIKFETYDEDLKIMTLSVASNFIKDNILKLAPEIEQCLSGLFGYKCSISFITKKYEDIVEVESLIKEKQISDDISFLENKLSDTESTGSNSINSLQILREGTDQSDSTEDYSFDSFVIGNSNEFAAKSARIVAQKPGLEYNPYFIYGGSGLGKTHLLRSIEKYIKETYPDKIVKYTTSEEFGNDFYEHLNKKQMPQFRMKYRRVDVLLLDDIQFFENKSMMQEEIFHTFNQLYHDFKQMVFSCDQPIKQVSNLEERVRQRFGMGLNVDLIPPDFELRMAILKNEKDSFEIKIDNEALEYIATNISGSIRDLKSSFRIVRAYYSIMKKPITLAIVKDKLKDKINEAHNSPISVDTIITRVAEYYNLKSHDLTGTKRTKSIVMARQIAMYLSRKETRLSTTQIGAYFGGKEHGTVMHATKKIGDMIDTVQETKKDIELILKKLQ